MSSRIERIETSVRAPESSDAAAPLAPIISLRWALTWRHAVVAATFAGFFVLLHYVPLQPFGLFRDLIDGRAIVESGGLPQSDPLLPFAETSRFAILNAGGALLEQGVWNAAGAEGLAILSALLTWGAVALWCRIVAIDSRDSLAAAAMLAWSIAIAWGSFGVAGTHQFGHLLFAVTMTLLHAAGYWGGANRAATAIDASSRRRWLFLLVPLFALWANLDASWLLGVGVLVVTTFGALLDAGLRRSAGRATDRTSRHDTLDLTLATLGATAATLLNPIGWDLWGLAMQPVATNPLIAMLGRIAPVSAWSMTGLLVGVALAVAGWALSRRLVRWSAVESVLFATAIVAAFAHPLARTWALPLVGALLIPSMWRGLSSRLSRWAFLRTANAGGPTDESNSDRETSEPHRFAFAWTLMCGLAVWTGFALSPISNAVFGSKGRALSQVVAGVPFEELPADLFADETVFAPDHWAEALAFAMPAAADLDAAPASTPRVMSDARQAFLFPAVRADYRRIAFAQEGWSRLLDRYEIRTLLVDRKKQTALASAAEEDPHWRAVSRTESTIVFRREERLR